MTFTAAEQAAMRRALELAASPDVPLGPNPRVGCVLLDDAGRTVAEGFHRGAGTPHAEAGADVFVAGSAVYSADDPDRMVAELRARAVAATA